MSEIHLLLLVVVLPVVHVRTCDCYLQSLRATKHDQMADEMAEPYFLYGKALLEIARQEADFLGTAVPGGCTLCSVI